MNRRHFLGSILALGVAPAIVRADSLMRIVPRFGLRPDGSILFDGTAGYLRTADFAITEPQTIYLLSRQTRWFRPDTMVFDGDGKITEWRDANGGPSLVPVGNPTIIIGVCDGKRSKLLNHREWLDSWRATPPKPSP